jgi:SPP1 gp7 family putative phage head morphogenesis protein
MADQEAIRATVGLPPDRTVRYFEAKGYRMSRAWTDTWQEEHTRWFTVAHVARLDILETIRRSIDEAARSGMTFEQWKTNVVPELQKQGWWGMVRDASLTGTSKDIYVGPRRLRTIYDTNMRMSRAAGQWQRIQARKESHPYLWYRDAGDRRVRPAHRRWNGIVLPVDHAFWDTHFPPNDWFCRCEVIQLRVRDLQRFGLRETTDAELAARRVPDRTFWRRGSTEREIVPDGIGPGFAYNVGKAHMRGLEPPPLSGPLAVPHILSKDSETGVTADLPAMPAPRQEPASVLLPRDTKPDDAIAAFLDEIGGARAGGAIATTDKLGEPLLVSESFFFRGGARADGASKLGDPRRIETMRLLAKTLVDPDEIWWAWEIAKDRQGREFRRLVRRYIAVFEVDGLAQPYVVIMDVGADGWKGVSAIPAARMNYVDKPQVRGGVLAYRRT